MDISKILPKLKTKYKDLGFSDKAFQGVADYLATTFKDDATDEDIDNGVAGVEALLKAFNGDADRRATAASEKAKKDAASKKQETGGTPAKEEEPATPPTDAPDYVKAMLEQMKVISGEIATLKTEKTTGTRKQILEEKLKDAPEIYRNKVLKDFARMRFDKDEDFEAYLTETEEDAKAFDQELTDKDLGLQSTPQRGKGGKDDKPATKEEVSAVIDSIM